MRRLFEGGVYSRAAFIRGNTVSPNLALFADMFFPFLLCLLKAFLYSFEEWYGFYGTAECILWD